MNNAAISPAHVELLVSYLNDDVKRVSNIGRDLQDSGDTAGYARLLFAAFVIATRRHFHLTWSRSEAIRYVADVRTRSKGHPDLDPLAGELMIQRALGEGSGDNISESLQTKAMLNLLEAMVSDAELDSRGVSSLVAEAQSAAPSIFPESSA